MKLEKLVEKYIKKGYLIKEAEAKVCQDILLLQISKSSFHNNITIKGGVIMQNISNDIRRSTLDLDLDFIRYKLDDESIKNFISNLNVDNELKFEIYGNIKDLKQHDYHGKRVYLKIRDNFDYEIKIKLDIGVHNYIDLKQEEYCFDLNVLGKKVVLLVNSKEQIFTEKLKSLLRMSNLSTRYKDILDFYYLIKYGNMDRIKLKDYINKLIFDDHNVKENSMLDIYNKLKLIFISKNYYENFKNIKNNWLELPIEEVIDDILAFINEL